MIVRKYEKLRRAISRRRLWSMVIQKYGKLCRVTPVEGEWIEIIGVFSI